MPGFVEIDLIGHEGGNSRGEFCFALDITNIAAGWSETRSLRNKAPRNVRSDLFRHRPRAVKKWPRREN